MRFRIAGGVAIAILAVLGIGVFLAAFTVSPAQQALVLRFGQPIDQIDAPGLYFKVPLIDNVVYIEKRILDLNSPPLNIIASDQKRLVIDAFGRYRITNPLLFYQAVGTVEVAQQRLSGILDSAIRRVLGAASFQSIVRDDRAGLMASITQQVNEQLGAVPPLNPGANNAAGPGQVSNLGIIMVDVKIRRADLPDANSQAIYARMQTQRQQEATQIRSTGLQAAQTRTAEADRVASVTVAEANRTSEQLRGDGDAQVSRIFAQAFSRDPEFFAFYRSLQAYATGLAANDTRLVITPDSEFFRFFADPLGGGVRDSIPTVDAPRIPVPPPAAALVPPPAIAPAIPAAPTTPPSAAVTPPAAITPSPAPPPAVPPATVVPTPPAAVTPAAPAGP